jgi:hypothetical protein
VIAQPGNAIDARTVAEWVSWVFSLEPGTDISGVGHLVAIAKHDTEATVMQPFVSMEELEAAEAADPAAAVRLPNPVPLPLSRAGWIWVAGALAIAFVLAAFLAWKVVG